ncbi:hypothetical protein BLA29_009304, partial [Euroglyphus maynei]
MEIIRRRYYHPMLRDRLKSILNSCVPCQRFKDYDSSTKTSPTRDYSSFDSNEHWAIDVADIGSSSKGNKFLIAMIDLHTKFVMATPAK